MSDTIEKLLLDFWEAEMSGDLATANVFTSHPQDEDHPLPYAVLSLETQADILTNTGAGVDGGDLTVEVFHENWRTAMALVTNLRGKLRNKELSGDGAQVSNIRFQSGNYTQEPDMVWHFLHSYELRIPFNA